MFIVAQRELLRYLRRPLGYGVAMMFYLSQAIFFLSYIVKQSGDTPMRVSPNSYLFSGGSLLIVMALFIPSLTMRSFAEERTQGTWDALCSLGLGSMNIVLGKFIANVLMFSLWMLLLMIMPFAWAWHGDIDWSVLFYAVGFLILVAAHWTALCLWLTCRSMSMMAAYLIGGLSLIIYFLLHVLQGLLPDPFYKPLFDAVNINRALFASSQGLASSTDFLFYVTSTIIFLMLAVNRLEVEKTKKSIHLWIKRLVFCVGLVFALYLITYISHHYPKQWNLAEQKEDRLSEEFKKILDQCPDGVTLHAVFPKTAKKSKYAEAMLLVQTFLDRMHAYRPEIEIKRYDPDLDVLEMERMKDYSLLKSNHLGGIILRYKERSMAVPYHRLVSIKKVTVSNQPVFYIEALLAERELGKSLVNLTRPGPAPRVLALSGFSEVDLKDDSKLGGNKFANMVSQMGFVIDLYRPGLDAEVKLEDYAFALLLDPRQPLGDAGRDLVTQFMKKGLPLLAAKGIHRKKDGDGNRDLLKEYGIKSANKVIAQRRFRYFDEFTVPLTIFTGHTLLKELKENQNKLVFSDSDVLLETVAADPRFLNRPLVYTHKDPLIWAEANLETMQNKNFPPQDDEDLMAPLVVARAVERQAVTGIQPMLVALASRSPFENRFFDSDGHRLLLYKSIDWLVHQTYKVHLPPSPLINYDLNLNEKGIFLFQAFILGAVPFLLILLSIWVWLKSR